MRWAAPRFRVANFFAFCEAVRVLGGELKLEAVLTRPCRGNRILRDDAAVPFQLDREIVAGQNSAAEVEDVSETAGGKTMVQIISHVRLDNARVMLAKGAAAIDEFPRDVSDLGNVKMGRDDLAVRQPEARGGRGMGTEKRLQFMQLHAVSIYR
jgi:hypothetical protein